MPHNQPAPLTDTWNETSSPRTVTPPTIPSGREAAHDCAWLRFWADRAADGLEALGVSEYIWIAYRPPHFLTEALPRISADHPGPVAEIRAALTAADDAFDAFERSGDAYAAEANLADRIDMMARTIHAAADAIEARQAQAVPDTAAPVTWEDARKRGIAIVEAEGWMGERRLAGRLGCNRKTVSKAVEHSKYLRDRRDEAKAAKRGQDAQERRDGIGSTKLAAGELLDEKAERPDESAELDELIADQKRDESRERRGLA